jgi:acyl-CoA thioesterase I
MSRRCAGMFLGLALPLGAVAAPAPCPPTPAMSQIAVPHLQAAIDHTGEALIVALGSSSTQGAMASDQAHSYPAILQHELSKGLPQAHVAVVNRGIGGQDAAEELTRLEADVIAVRPQLVIWQVGANGALRNVDPDVFRETVTAGVKRLRAAGADVILMDNQQAPKLLATAEESLLDKQLADVASETGAALFSRRALMRGWDREGASSVQFIATDGLHHNDRGYYCVAHTLAQSILADFAPTRHMTASR